MFQAARNKKAGQVTIGFVQEDPQSLGVGQPPGPLFNLRIMMLLECTTAHNKEESRNIKIGMQQ